MAIDSVYPIFLDFLFKALLESPCAYDATVKKFDLVVLKSGILVVRENVKFDGQTGEITMRAL